MIDVTKNSILMHRNLFLEDYAPGGVLTASSEITPVQNLRDQRPGVKWINDGGATESVFLDLGKVYSAQHFCSYAHTPTYDGSIRVRLGGASDPTIAAPLVDRSINPVPATRRFGAGPFGFGRLGGFPTTAGKGARPPLAWMPLKDPATGVFPRVFFRYARIDFSGIDYVGNLFLGEGFQPSLNFVYDWSLDREDGSLRTDTWSSVNAVRGVQRRILKIQYPIMDPREANLRMDALLTECGTSSAAFAVLRPYTDSPSESVNARAYGLLPDAGSISHPYPTFFSAPFSIREMVE